MYDANSGYGVKNTEGVCDRHNALFIETESRSSSRQNWS